jgi:hypothetical protein
MSNYTLPPKFSYAKESRKERGRTQPIYLMERNDVNILFILCGSTKNLYTVKKNIVTDKFTCTCPDYMNRHRNCKHIYFVKDRVLKYSNSSLPPNELIHKYLSKHINKTHSHNKEVSHETKLSCKNLHEDDNNICVICFEEMTNDELTNKDLFTCEQSCGTHFHNSCIMMWFNQGKTTCPFCRYNIESQSSRKKRKINNVPNNYSNVNYSYVNLLDD